MTDSKNKGAEGLRRRYTANGSDDSLLGYNYSYLRDDEEVNGHNFLGYNYSYLKNDINGRDAKNNKRAD